MAAYRLQIKASAIEELEAVERVNDRRRIVRRIQDLARDPRPPGCQKLVGGENRYRIRQGRFRVVYSVDDRDRTVEVVRVGDRRDVYR